MPHVVPTQTFVGKPQHKVRAGAIISQADLDRIRGNAVNYHIEEQEKVDTANRKRMTREELAEQRLQRTKQGDLQRTLDQPASDAEKVAAARAEALNNKAERAKVEEDDIAKIMSSLELQARAFAVRDRQVVIAQRAAVDEQVFKQRDHEKNLEDLRKLKQEEELQRQAKLREREMLRQHNEAEMKRKEREKLLAEEAKLREAEEYKAEYQRQLEHQRQLALERAAEIKRQNEETARINDEAAKRKALLAEQERKLDQEIKERQILDEAAFLKEERDKRIKAKQDMIDFYRQKQEYYDNSAVEREIQKARENAAREKDERAYQARQEEIRQQRLKEYNESLAFEKQAAQEKALRMQKKSVEQARELQKLKEDRKQWEMEQIEANQKKIEQIYQNKQDYQTQLLAKAKMQSYEDPKLEKEKIEREASRRRDLLEALRQEKIAKLRAAGVAEKYIADLKNLNIDDLLRKQ